MPAVVHVLIVQGIDFKGNSETQPPCSDDGLVCRTQEEEEVEYLQLDLAGGRILASVKYSTLLALQSRTWAFDNG